MTADQWLPGTGRGRLGKNRLQASTKNFYLKGEGYVHYLDCHDGFTNVCVCVYIYICLNSSNLHALSICGLKYSSDQIRSVAQSCPTLCDPMNCSTPGLPVHHQLLDFTQTHVHRVSDAIQPSHPLSSTSPPAPNPSQHQNLFQ